MEIINKSNYNENDFKEVDLLNIEAEEARKSDNNLSLTLSKEAIG